MVPSLVIAGAAALLVVAGFEIFGAVQTWLAGGAWPSGLALHVLVAGAALLLAAAVLMNRRSVRRTAAAEAARHDSEERLRLIANSVPALISYIDREQRYRFGNRTVHEVVSGERDKIMELIRRLANEDASKIGVEVLDVRMKRVDLPQEVSESVYRRMEAERKAQEAKEQLEKKSGK